jgi:hypothetical protein
MSQIQGMKPEPPHRHGGQGENPAASLSPSDGGSIGDGHAGDVPRLAEDGTLSWPPGWDDEKKAAWRRQNDLAPPSEAGSGP